MKSTYLSLTIAFATLSLTSAARAVVVIDNLSPAGAGFAANVSGPVGAGILAPPPNRETAFSFVTGATDTYLTELLVSVNISNNSVGLQASISTGTAVPGGTNEVIIGTVAPASTSPTTQTLNFTPASTILLDASTQYWIHFTVASGSGSYTINNTQNQVIEPGWTLENTVYYQPSGWIEVNGPQARVRLSVDPVPETSSTLFGCLGAFLLLRRRR